MKLNSFFAGIGGFDLGFEKVGFKVGFQCEINEFCCSVLRNHWPDNIIKKDIRDIDPNKIPDADVWSGGFPCQDVSVARGSKGRDGLKGKNSGLFFNFLDLIEDKKPKIVLLENVTGLLNSHEGKDFKIIIDSLVNLGYGVSWRVLNTRYFGAPQSRPRVYICAWHNSPENAAYALHEYIEPKKPENPREAFLNESYSKKLGVYVPHIAYCLAATSGRHTGTDWSRTYISYDSKVRRLTPTEAEKLQGFPENWTLPNNKNNNKKELDSLRYHAAGNAVSVPTVMWVAERIKNGLLKRNGYSSFEEVLKKFEYFSNVDKSNTERADDYKWLTGGIAFKGDIYQNKVPACPSQIINSKLINVIDRKEVEEKYFLSPSAARGIIRRVTSQNRTLFKPLHNALNQLSDSVDH